MQARLLPAASSYTFLCLQHAVVAQTKHIIAIVNCFFPIYESESRRVYIPTNIDFIQYYQTFKNDGGIDWVCNNISRQLPNVWQAYNYIVYCL